MRIIALIIAAAGLGGAGITLAQVVDSPGGAAAQMVPGGGAGKGVVDIAASAQGAGAKAVYVAPSESEQLSRTLLELKGQQASLEKLAADDPQRRDVDQQVTALRQEIGTRSVFGAAPVDGPSPDAAVETLTFPRIVEESAFMPEPAASRPSAPAPAPAPNPMAQTFSQESQETAAARALLAHTAIDLTSQAATLEKVLTAVQEQTHANFLINWTALATANIDRNTPVNLNLRQVNADRALKAVLDQAGGGTVSLGYTLDDGVVTVSTKEDLSSTRYQHVRVYDVRDLLATEATFSQFAVQVYARRVDNLCEAIKSAVAPDTWRDAGGTIGSIRELNGMLIINQTADNLRLVEALLAQLRGR